MFAIDDFNTVKAEILAQTVNKSKLVSILDKASRLEALNQQDIITLLAPETVNYLDLIKETAHYINTVRHGRIVNFYAPLYISNSCVNNCVYCGFRHDNKTTRVTLSIEKALEEAKVIKNTGIEHLLIVSGEDPVNINLEYLVPLVNELKGLFSSISIEIAPMKTEEYAELFKAGVDGLACYQETYDPKKYREYHISGPKSNYQWRLETHDRGGQAGFRNLTLGSLLGVSEYYVEAYFFIKHAQYLAKKYWKSLPSISFPRFRPYGGEFEPKYPVSDIQMKHVIGVSRIVLPNSNMVISTRETPEFREEAILYGINQMSAGSKTSPLGYTGETAKEQFSVNDTRSVGEVASAVKKLGYEPVFKNWDMGFNLQG